MIYLYKNNLPNYESNTHYLFTDPSVFFDFLGTPALSFEEDRYTINANILEVKLPAVTDMNDITYLAWNNSNSWRFFWVRSAVYQSGFAILNLEIDLWATFIAQAEISNIRINRCNRNVGAGVYDRIPVTQGRQFVQLGDDMDESDLSIVYVVVFATSVSTILVNAASTAIGVFANEISTMFPDIVNEDGTTSPNPNNTIDGAISAVSGIYSAKAVIGDVDANVIAAYIVPSNVLANKIGGTPVFKFRAPSEAGELLPSFEVAPFIFPVAFDIDIDPNNKYFVGTKLSGLELARVTSQARVYYNFITKQDGLQVIVQQGDRMRDITDAFEVGLTSNDGNLTASQKIAKTLQTVGGAASGVFQIMSGGAGLVTGAISTANALTGIVNEGNARYTAGGDGVNTFRLITGAATSPYYMQINTSIDDEKANARLYGAVFNQQLDTIDEALRARLLGTGSLMDTFIAADLRVDGVPVEARNFIVNSFREGIYLVKL